jgi:hypothetical protein
MLEYIKQNKYLLKMPNDYDPFNFMIVILFLFLFAFGILVMITINFKARNSYYTYRNKNNVTMTTNYASPQTTQLTQLTHNENIKFF